MATRKIGEHAGEAKQVLASNDVDKLEEMSEDIAKAMDDLL